MHTTYTSEDRTRAALLAAKAKRQSELRITDLTRHSLARLRKILRRWWLQRVERHCMICADVEEQHARQAQQNVAYYQKQAAMARLARH